MVGPEAKGYLPLRENFIPEALGRLAFTSLAMTNPAPKQATMPTV
jgi:hypothetical protein